MIVAAQLYTLREEMQDLARAEQALAGLREIGYDTVEVAGLGPDVAGGFATLLAEAGLHACAAHVSLEALVADLAAEASRCREWGCSYVVVPSLPAEYHSGAGFRRFATLAADLARNLQRYGLRLAYHNHAFELERRNGTTGLEVLYASAQPDDLDAELDTYWLQFAGASPEAWLRRLRGRVPLVHLKDMAMSGGQPVQAEVGEGNLDWPSILAACREGGTRWLVVEQDESSDPLESLALSYRNLTRMLAG